MNNVIQFPYKQLPLTQEGRLLSQVFDRVEEIMSKGNDKFLRTIELCIIDVMATFNVKSLKYIPLSHLNEVEKYIESWGPREEKGE